MRKSSITLSPSPIVTTGGPIGNTDISDIVLDWRCSSKLVGGYWDASFSLPNLGKRLDIVEAFENWLGLEITERYGGVITWQGMIAEMELTYNKVTRRRSLLDMANAVDSLYRTKDYIGANQLDNADFENPPYVPPPPFPGAAYDFADWVEVIGPLADIGVHNVRHAGAQSVIITSGTDDTGYNWPPDATYIYQVFGLTSEQMYQLSFWVYRSVGANATLMYAITADPDWGGTGFPGNLIDRGPFYFHPTQANVWEHCVRTFKAPPSGDCCVIFMASQHVGDVILIDDCSVLAETDVVYNAGYQIYTGSIERYGRREELLLLDNCNLATATAGASSYLSQVGWPYAGQATFNAGADRLTVTAIGYVQTMNWLYQTVGTGLEQNQSDWITSIIGTTTGLSTSHGGTIATAGDCQFVSAGRIVTNPLQVVAAPSVQSRAWDVILDLCRTGIEWPAASGTYVPIILWVGDDRLVHCQPFDANPRYRWYGNSLRNLENRVLPGWLVRPGVVRDLTYPTGVYDSGSLFLSRQDVLVDTVEHDAEGNVKLQPVEFDIADLFGALGERSVALEQFRKEQEEKRRRDEERRRRRAEREKFRRHQAQEARRRALHPEMFPGPEEAPPPRDDWWWLEGEA